jgi:hypothetical protein
MRELFHVRPSYQTGGGDGDPSELPDAHRLVRNAVAIGAVIGVPYQVVESARDAVVRIENISEGEQVFRLDEVRALLELLRETHARLDASLDEKYRPGGEGGDLILEEAGRPEAFLSGETDFDRVFHLNDDGSISSASSRMSLDAFLELVPEAIEFLRRAVELQLELVWVE